MSTPLYCWRCRTVIPMLDEDEWAQVAERLSRLVGDLKRLRQERSIPLSEATKLAGAGALRRFRELTGYEETNVNALWHHRRSLFGPPCDACGKPLRTPRPGTARSAGHHEQRLSDGFFALGVLIEPARRPRRFPSAQPSA